MVYSYVLCGRLRFVCFFFFFNDTATTEIYTLSLHDALPILLEFPNLFDLSALVRPINFPKGEVHLVRLAWNSSTITVLEVLPGFIYFAIYLKAQKF